MGDKKIIRMEKVWETTEFIVALWEEWNRLFKIASVRICRRLSHRLAMKPPIHIIRGMVPIPQIIPKRTPKIQIEDKTG